MSPSTTTMPATAATSTTTSTITAAASQHLRHQIYYHLDNDLPENANFLAGRLHALEPRNPDNAHLLALSYLRLSRCRAAYDISQKHGANGRHLGCAWVFAQACLRLGGGAGRAGEGVAALEKARNSWVGCSSWGKHSEASRWSLPDAAAVWTLMGKLWQVRGDAKKAGDCFVEAHRANPFVWEAFEGLCKVGADLNVGSMFKPTSEMGIISAAATAAGSASGPGVAAPSSSEIYQDDLADPSSQQPARSQQSSFNQQTFTPSADPFNSKHDGQSVSGFGLFNIKGKSGQSAAVKQPFSEWDTPTTSSGVLDEDVTMGGVLVDEESYAAQPPAAPARRARPGQQFEPSDRPRQPTLRAHAHSSSEGIHDPDATTTAQRRPASAAGGQKRTVSGQATSTSQAGSAATASSLAPPRRSNRLFGQTTTTRSTRSAAESTASIAGRVDGTARPSKPATGTKGRIGSTVGRVVSGNRKVLPPDRGDKEKDRRAPSRNGEKNFTAAPAPAVTTAVVLPPSKEQLLPTDASQESSKAVKLLLDNFRELAVGCYATSRFQLREAINTFQLLPSAQRETPWVLAQFGKAYYEAGEYKNAEECFARAMKLQPSRIEDAEVYSTVLWHLKKDADLALLCHTLRDLDFHAPQTWCAIGNAFSLSREHDQAIAAFKRATQIDDDFAYAWTLMGHEFIANEEYEAALASFRKSVAVDRRGYGGWYGLAKSYERQGKLEEAEQYYRIAASINPSNATLLVCIGVVLERLRKKRAALAYYSKALELKSESALARFKKARVLMYLRLWHDALLELLILRDQAPDEANVWFLLGKCHKFMGDKSEALRSLTTALNLDVKAAPFIKEAMENLDIDDQTTEESDQ